MSTTLGLHSKETNISFASVHESPQPTSANPGSHMRSSSLPEFLADRKVKWVAPATVGVSQHDMVEKSRSHQLDGLSETYDALETGELELVPR
jgi:hypothetical protein